MSAFEIRDARLHGEHGKHAFKIEQTLREEGERERGRGSVTLWNLWSTWKHDENVSKVKRIPIRARKSTMDGEITGRGREGGEGQCETMRQCDRNKNREKFRCGCIESRDGGNGAPSGLEWWRETVGTMVYGVHVEN